MIISDEEFFSPSPKVPPMRKTPEGKWQTISAAGDRLWVSASQ
jgi:hypothetical protein